MAKKTATYKPTQLDDEMSALVLAEYLVIGNVTGEEIDSIDKGGRGATVREIALTFRISETLDIPDAFAMSPKFEAVFAMLRGDIGRTIDAATVEQRATREEDAHV